MKRTQVFEYSIEGSIFSWPVEVDLSRNEASGRWTLYFRYVDPEARHSESVTAYDASDVHAALEGRNASVLNFAESVEAAAVDMPTPAQQQNLVALARALRELPLAETDGG